MYVKRGREHTARPCGIPCALARHQRPGVLAQPPRRPIAATPPLRPVLDHKAGTEAALLRLHNGAAYFKAARRAATSRAECKKQKAHSTQPHRAPELGGAALRRDKRLAVKSKMSSFCRATTQRNKGSEVAVALKANSAVRHLRRVRHVKAGPVETRRRGTSTTHTAHQHTSWANSRGRGQQQEACQWQHFTRQRKRMHMTRRW